MFVARNVSPVAALALACIVAAGVASAERPPVTQADSGKTFHLAKGASITLRLSNRWHWSEPHASTKAVELTPVEYFVDPGFREWTIDARRRGVATLRAVGTASCTRCTVAPRRFAVAIVVR